MIERISILGTGLLGTSVGLALRGRDFAGRSRAGIASAEQGQLALKMGAVDSLAADPIEAARASQVMVLAVPIYATLDWMEKLAPVLGPEQLVTDVGSTKRVISETAARLLQHAGTRGVSSRASDGGQRARRRGAGRCGSVSRRGVAVY